MNKNKIFKGFALLNAIALVTLFLSYRSGAFDDFLYNNNHENSLTSHNGGAPAVQPNNAAEEKPGFLKVIEHLPSSKVIVLPKDFVPLDTVPKTNTINVNLQKPISFIQSSKWGSVFETSVWNTNPSMMYSSKSGKIFDASQSSLSANTIKKVDTIIPANPPNQNIVPTENIEQVEPPKAEKKVSKSSALGMDKDFMLAASSKSAVVLSEKDQILRYLADFDFSLKSTIVNLFNTHKRRIGSDSRYGFY